METVMSLWNFLGAVTRLQIAARTIRGPQAVGSDRAIGTVKVTRIHDTALLFTESGHWTSMGGKTLELPFHNSYRWWLVDQGRRLRLEHLRLGADHPVFLCDLAPADHERLKCVTPHLCGADQYVASLELKNQAAFLRWKVCGPAKDQEIHYTYS